MDCSTPGFPVLQSPGVCSNSCPLSWWYHPTISSSVVPFFCTQSFPALESFPMKNILILCCSYFSFLNLEEENSLRHFSDQHNFRMSDGQRYCILSAFKCWPQWVSVECSYPSVGQSVCPMHCFLSSLTLDWLVSLLTGAAAYIVGACLVLDSVRTGNRHS